MLKSRIFSIFSPSFREGCIHFFILYIRVLKGGLSMEYISIPCFVVICYLFAELLKAITRKNETVKRAIPGIAGLLGGLLGFLTFRFYPEFISVKTVFEAIAIGIISGLASTGSNQIIKQLLKGEDKNAENFF